MTHAHTPECNKRPPLDLKAITSRITALGVTRSCPHCATAVSAIITDLSRLLAELAALYDELTTARLESANLRAAMQAALGAADDGEPDPLAFLRWELAGPSGHRGRR